MNSVSATIDGATVNVVEIQQNGSDVYIAYIDTSNNLKVTKKTRNYTTSAGTTIGTNATVVN